MLKDYTKLTEDELKTEVQARHLRVYDLRPSREIYYAKALQDSDIRDLRKYREWKLRIQLPLNPSFQDTFAKGADFELTMKARCRHMFESTYKADPNKITFLHLPGEIRNYIYEYALLGGKALTESTVWPEREGTQSQITQRRQAHNLAKFHQNMEIYTLAMLDVVNKQIHKETQSFFLGPM